MFVLFGVFLYKESSSFNLHCQVSSIEGFYGWSSRKQQRVVYMYLTTCKILENELESSDENSVDADYTIEIEAKEEIVLRKSVE